MLTVLMYKSSGDDMMEHLRKINENETFSTAEQLNQRINNILYFATYSGCGIYETFFDGNYNLSSTDNHNIFISYHHF